MRLSIASTIAVIMLTGLAAPVLAQDGTRGIAFVQAPEQGGGVAMGATAEEAFAAAVEQCMESGARDEDCLRTNWCSPAGWSVDMFLQHKEGVHWHEVVCGLPTEAIARATALHMCDQSERDYIAGCMLAQIYNPDGEPLLEP